MAATKLTKSKIEKMKAGREIDQLVDDRFYWEQGPGMCSRETADAAVLLEDLALRMGDIHLEYHNADKEWACSTCFDADGGYEAAGEWRGWVRAKDWKLAVCKAALLTTLKPGKGGRPKTERDPSTTSNQGGLYERGII